MIRSKGAVAGEIAWAVAGALAVLGATPVWLAPLVQALDGSAVAANLALAVSPLVHLAAATGSDLLRTDWFYRHSSIASLYFSYPRVGAGLLAYTVICMAAFTAAVVAGRQGRRPALLQTNEINGEIQR